jgi:two-component system LytT family response regulator
MIEARPTAAPLRVLVVDDEAPARARLRRLLAPMTDVVVVGEADGGLAAVTAIGTQAPDVVLLDVQMPGLDGFGVVQAVGVEAMPVVIFVTAHDAHALRAFEVRALDYLLKPVAPERLAEALARARVQVAREQAAGGAGGDGAGDAPAALAGLAVDEPRRLTHLLVHDERAAQLLPVAEIAWARAERNYVRVHAARGSFTVRGTIGGLAARLDREAFLRVNRSDLVRLSAIRELQPWFHGDYRVVLQDGTQLMWSRRYRARDGAAFELP